MFHFESSKNKIYLSQVQGGQEELSEIQEKDHVKEIDENLHISYTVSESQNS